MSIEKRIFILGAGASIGHSNDTFPNINGFFRKAKELGFNKEDFFKKIRTYVDFFIGKDIENNNVNIEDVFTHLEIEIERTSISDLVGYRYWLIRIIIEVLLRLEAELHDDNDFKGEYHSFVSHLRPEDTILTFNWDTLLDNVLGKEFSFSDETSVRIEKTKPQYLNFWHHLTGHGEATLTRMSIEPPYPFDGSSRKKTTQLGYYLKLHGSIDYFCCNNTSCRAFGKLFTVIDPSKQHLCGECDEVADVLIVPPVLNKAIRQYPAIRRIWNLAKRQVESATEIIIWGYSLPTGDYYSTWLLRQARFMPISKFVIINKIAAEQTPKGFDLQNRLLDPLLDKLREEDIKVYSSFGEYLEAQ